MDTKTLIAAAARGDLSAVRNALESGVNVNSQTMYSYQLSISHVGYVTALAISAFHGHLEVVHYLEEAGANPFLPLSYFGKTPIDLARETKNDVMESYLHAMMKHSKWMNEIDKVTGYTPLTYSIFNKYTDLHKVKALVNSGADVCKMNRRGKTPLIYAIEKNWLDIVELLLEKGAIASGVSGLKCAIDLRCNDIGKCLIACKQSLVEVFLDDGFTPLTKSVSTCNLEIANYLIEHGANPIKSDLNGNTPLEKALEVHCAEIAEMLVSKGAKVPKTMKQTLFHRLAQVGNIQIYDFLLRNQWDVNQVDEDGKTALALSASKENLLLSRLLIENGAQIDLALTEVEAFKKQNLDFNWFFEQIVAKKQRSECQTGQE